MYMCETKQRLMSTSKCCKLVDRHYMASNERDVYVVDRKRTLNQNDDMLTGRLATNITITSVASHLVTGRNPMNEGRTHDT